MGRQRQGVAGVGWVLGCEGQQRIGEINELKRLRRMLGQAQHKLEKGTAGGVLLVGGNGRFLLQ